MKTVYGLKIINDHDRNVFVCRKIEIEKLVEVVSIVKEDGIVVRENITKKIKLFDEKKLHSYNDMFSDYFSTLDELKKHFKEEYVEVHRDKYHVIFLDTDDLNSVFRVSIPQEYQGLANGFISLYETLELSK